MRLGGLDGRTLAIYCACSITITTTITTTTDPRQDIYLSVLYIGYMHSYSYSLAGTRLTLFASLKRAQIERRDDDM